jgi:peptidyl-prolyl cis-trans isomerase C
MTPFIWRMNKLKVFREPLLQFFIIGLCIYGAYGLYGVSNNDLENNTVVVDENRIAAFTNAWQQRWSRPPTEKELTGLINQFVREDIFYREAVAMGLDQDDPITRRRLAQKLEFLSKDIAALKEPEQDELEQYFVDNIEQYRTPDMVTFKHVFIDPDKRGDATLDDAALILAELQAVAPTDSDVSLLGDRFMLQNYYSQQSELDIRKLFGSGFAKAVMQLETKQWHGPVLSGYGTHLVYIDIVDKSPAPKFEQVQEAVFQNWLTDQQEQFNEAYFESLKSRYEIVIERAQVGPSSTNTNVAEETNSNEVPTS